MMKQYLINTFRFNDWANKLTLSAMQNLADKKESVILFSHLIRAQNKWMLRVKNDPTESQIKWFDTPFEFEELTNRWEVSLNEWLGFLSDSTDTDLDKEISYTAGTDESSSSTLLHDIALQLNYHSILHRAQICMRIHEQGFEPPHVDYIYYVWEK